MSKKSNLKRLAFVIFTSNCVNEFKMLCVAPKERNIYNRRCQPVESNTITFVNPNLPKLRRANMR